MDDILDVVGSRKDMNFAEGVPGFDRVSWRKGRRNDKFKAWQMARTAELSTEFRNRNELRIGYDVQSSLGRGGLHSGSPGAKPPSGLENLPRSFWHELSSPFTEVYEGESSATETGATPEPRPFFEDSESNVTVQRGAQVYMNCRVQNLQDSLKVSWFRRRGEELHLLTIGFEMYVSDSRFSPAFEKPNDWRLLLRSATERDAGLYECQVSAHPPLIRTVHLTVLGLLISSPPGTCPEGTQEKLKITWPSFVAALPWP
ncbi:hypothetical protein KM043_005215 [Ampulex compressa]|nr:hypothetical protein KM043_005215 [Ampulex compressa]